MPAPRWFEMTEYLVSRGIKVGAGTLGQTTGGTHTRGSYHYQGVARDFGVYNCDCPAIAAALKPLATGANHVIVELIWTPSPLSRSSGPGTYYKHGNAYVPSVKLANGHKDHVHAAIKPGAPHWTSWPGARSQPPKPQPVPVPKPPVPVEEDRVSHFIRGNGNIPNSDQDVYVVAEGCPPQNVGSPETLKDLYGLGHGRSPIPPGAATEVTNTVKVIVAEQRFMNDLLANRQ